MELRSLNINRCEYGPNIGKLSGRITVKAVGGWGDSEMTVEIPEEVVIPMMQLVSQAILQEVTRGLTQVQKDAEAVMLGKPIDNNDPINTEF